MARALSNGKNKGNKNLGVEIMEYKKSLTAPCGLDCFNCEIHEDNLTNDFIVGRGQDDS